MGDTKQYFFLLP